MLKFGDKVIVTEGFFEGSKGTVKNTWQEFWFKRNYFVKLKNLKDLRSFTESQLKRRKKNGKNN